MLRNIEPAFFVCILNSTVTDTEAARGHYTQSDMLTSLPPASRKGAVNIVNVRTDPMVQRVAEFQRLVVDSSVRCSQAFAHTSGASEQRFNMTWHSFDIWTLSSFSLFHFTTYYSFMLQMDLQKAVEKIWIQPTTLPNQPDELSVHFWLSSYSICLTCHPWQSSHSWVRSRKLERNQGFNSLSKLWQLLL